MIEVLEHIVFSIANIFTGNGWGQTIFDLNWTWLKFAVVVVPIAFAVGVGVQIKEWIEGKENKGENDGFD